MASEDNFPPPPCRPVYTFADRIKNLSWAAVGAVFGAGAMPLIDIVVPIIFPFIEPTFTIIMTVISVVLRSLGLSV